jgi:hypothetical protein
MIRLHRIVSRLDLAAGLDPALTAFSRGHSALACQELTYLDRALSMIPKPARAPHLALRARGSVLALSEVLEKHALYFDAGVSK